MTTLLLVRHGETDWNAEHRWQGQTDVPLNERGREQARALAQTLAREPIAAVYSSDLQRARETAEILAAELGLPVASDPRLRELDFGRWEGLTTPEVEERFFEDVQRWRAEDGAAAAGGGETYEQMRARVVAALADIARQHDGKEALVVLHGGPIRSALAHAAGVTYGEQRRLRAHLDNCGAVRIAVESGRFRAID